MDLSFELAKKLQSDIIIANDPDADRLAVGIRTDSGYQMLTGDQVGLLLAEATVSSGKKGTVANSIVSASLAPLAKHYGVEYRQTLTSATATKKPWVTALTPATPRIRTASRRP
ncbi:MAG: hypothetical protein RL696_821 [Actinomycetota bacterium]